MFIKEANVKGFKCLRNFHFEFNEHMNIVVGDNDSGKSTLLESLFVALTGQYRGASIRQALSQDLFNIHDVESFANNPSIETLPKISIEVFLEGDERDLALFEGDFCSKDGRQTGFTFFIEFDAESYLEECLQYLKDAKVDEVPIEYYRISWISFARSQITPRSIGFPIAFIDATSGNRQQDSRRYMTHLIKNTVQESEEISLVQEYRKQKGLFSNSDSIAVVNERLGEIDNLSGKSVSLGVETGTRSSWADLLSMKLNQVPFDNGGRGSQSVIGIELSLIKTDEKPVGLIMIEEPESHLSHSGLNMLLSRIEQRMGENQMIVSTHSSFVANKLDINNIILLHNGLASPLCSPHSDGSSISFETGKFFSKAAGYDTLRLVLCQSAILVEGDSDELVVQRAYMDSHGGRLPIADGIDVISVGTAFLRFLEVAKSIGKPVAVITDNDGDIDRVTEKYDSVGYPICPDIRPSDAPNETIGIFFPKALLETGGIAQYSYNTLEPEIFEANGLEKMNLVLGKEFTSRDEALNWMRHNKTEAAFKIFCAEESINIPKYIEDAITFAELQSKNVSV